MGAPFLVAQAKGNPDTQHYHNARMMKGPLNQRNQPFSQNHLRHHRLFHLKPQVHKYEDISMDLKRVEALKTIPKISRSPPPKKKGSKRSLAQHKSWLK